MTNDATNEASEPTLLSALPRHPAPDLDLAAHRLEVSGAVGAPATYCLDDLLAWATLAHTEDFVCIEGWLVADQRWEGIPLGALLDRSTPLQDATHVLLGADDFTLVLTMERAREGLLAITLNGERLPVAHGGPMRFFLPGGECFTSIKWLDRIELLLAPRESTAEDIARRRIGLASGGK